MQKRENIEPRMSSVDISPVISPRWCIHSRMSCATKSVGMPLANPSATRLMASSANSSALWCRALVTITSLLSAVGSWAVVMSCCSSRSVPTSFLADRYSAVEWGCCVVSFCAVAFMLLSWVLSMRSVLLNAMMRFLSRQRGMMRCDSSSICCVGVVLSTSQMAISHCCSLPNVRSIPMFSMVSLVSRMPAVSINRNSVPPRVIVSSMTSRVVPCMSLTSARSS